MCGRTRRCVLMLKPYKNEEIKQIMDEAKLWHIKIYESMGSDYGYGQSSLSEYDTYCEIDLNIMVVEDGHFAGVQASSNYYSYNKTGSNDESLNVALIKYWSGEPM